MLTYNPFDKSSPEQLTSDDLQQLVSKGVAEGLYVEYKSDFKPYNSIGHSIASFANSYGGWYFIGVAADKQNRAANICGFDIRVHNDPLSRVRDAIRNHINPVPAVDLQLVPLDDHKSVLVARIHEDQDKPFITSDGRIYRRVGDASDPVGEKDRYAVDRLYDEGNKFQQRFNKFCEDDLIFDESEHRGWLKLYIAPYPNIPYKLSSLNTAEIERLLSQSKEPRSFSYSEAKLEASMPLDAGHQTLGSLLLRQVASNSVAHNNLSAEFFVDGWAKILIPIPFFIDFDWTDLTWLKSGAARDALTKIRDANTRQNLELIRFVRLGTLSNMIAILVNFYLDEWLGEQPTVTEYRYIAKIEDVHRTAPLIDDDEWGLYLQRYGLPMTGRKNISITSLSGEWLSFKPAGRKISFWEGIDYWVNLSFGVPTELQAVAFYTSIDDRLRQQSNHQP